MRPNPRLVLVFCVVAAAALLAGCGDRKSAGKPAAKAAVRAKTTAKKPGASGKQDARKSDKANEEPVDLAKLFGQNIEQPGGATAVAPALPGTLPGTPAPPAVAKPGQPPVAVPAAPGAPAARPTAKQLLAAVRTVYSRAQSFKAEYTSSMTAKQDGKTVQSAPKSSGSILFKRPDKFVISDSDVKLVSNGKTFYTYFRPAKRYAKAPMGKEVMSRVVFSKPGVGTLGLLLGVDYEKTVSSMKLLPDAKVGPHETYVLLLQLKAPAGTTATQTLWIGKRDLAVYKNRLVTELRPAAMEGAKQAQGKLPKLVVTDASSTATRLSPNLEVADSAFAFDPPAGAKPFEEPKKVELKGKPAPDFAFKAADGSEQKLSALHGKPVVLYFWALPQGAEHLFVVQKLYDQHKDSIHLVAVNLNPEVDKVNEFLKKKGLSFPVVRGTEQIAEVAASKYGLMGVPTLIIIDKNGVVYDGIVGNSTQKMIEEKLGKLSAG